MGKCFAEEETTWKWVVNNFTSAQLKNVKSEKQAKHRKLHFDSLNSDMYVETTQSSCLFEIEI